MEFAAAKKKRKDGAPPRDGLTAAQRRGSTALAGEAGNMMNAEYQEHHDHPEEEEHVRYDAPGLSEFKYEEQAFAPQYSGFAAHYKGLAGTNGGL
jgi:hypothetical protein